MPQELSPSKMEILKAKSQAMKEKA